MTTCSRFGSGHDMGALNQSDSERQAKTAVASRGHTVRKAMSKFGRGDDNFFRHGGGPDANSKLSPFSGNTNASRAEANFAEGGGLSSTTSSLTGAAISVAPANFPQSTPSLSIANASGSVSSSGSSTFRASRSLHSSPFSSFGQPIQSVNLSRGPTDSLHQSTLSSRHQSSPLPMSNRYAKTPSLQQNHFSFNQVYGSSQQSFLELTSSQLSMMADSLGMPTSNSAEPMEISINSRDTPAGSLSPSPHKQRAYSKLTVHDESKTAIPPSKWCISYQQLMDLDKQASKIFGAAEYPIKTMRDICNSIVAPLCARTGTSFSLSLNKKGLPIDVFVSHSWDGHFSAFAQSIRNAFQTTMTKPNLWICAFALVQGQNADLITQQVGSSEDPLEMSPFVQAIQSASTFCVVRNSQKCVYTRAWCVCELMYAKYHGLFPTKTHVTGPDVFGHLETSILDAQASRLQDRDRILRVLLNEFNREEIDGIVHQLRVQDAPQQNLDEARTPLHDTIVPREGGDCMHVFCYGSLRPDDNSGFPWTKKVLSGMRAQPGTVSGAKLYLDNGACLVFDDDNSHALGDETKVIGWVVTADPLVFRTKLRQINRIQGYQQDGNGLFRRTIGNIYLGDPGKAIGGDPIGPLGTIVQAYIYHRPECDKEFRIPSGDWLQLPYTGSAPSEDL